MIWTCLACGHRNQEEDGPVCDSCEVDARHVRIAVDTDPPGPLVRRSEDERDAYLQGMRAGFEFMLARLDSRGSPDAQTLRAMSDEVLALIRSTFAT